MHPGSSHRSAPSLCDLLAGSAETEVCEFVKWDRERQLEYLGKLESEAASLRYRNAVLAEENRALKLARIADQSIRRDLERDREELLAREAARTTKLQP
jgi:hypothetical protein